MFQNVTSVAWSVSAASHERSVAEENSEVHGQYLDLAIFSGPRASCQAAQTLTALAG